jgi:hypothetical protein
MDQIMRNMYLFFSRMRAPLLFTDEKTKATSAIAG